MKQIFWAILVFTILVPSCKFRRPAPVTAASDTVQDTLKIDSTSGDPVETTDFDDALETLSETEENAAIPVDPEHATDHPVSIAGTVEWDHTVHDFGDVLVSDGPLSCTFRLKNTGKEPLTILQVLTSCGCTDATWTRDEIPAGGTGEVSATYKNEDGPVYFDKNLTVYLSSPKKPILLHLRGQVHERKKPLSETYGAVRLGSLGLKTAHFKIGNLEQGEYRSEQATVANLGQSPISVSFKDISPNLTVSIHPNPIPVGETATLSATVRSDRTVWGRHTYTATPVVDGKSYAPLSFNAITKENFSSWTKEQKDNASQPIFKESTASLGVVGKGRECEVTFRFTNQGKSTFHCYGADSDQKVSIDPVPDVEPGGEGSFKVRLNTSDLPEGEATVYLTLITNSPLRPIVNLFIVGDVK